MADYDLELDQLAQLFVSAATAVQTTQQALDTVRVPIPDGRGDAVHFLTYAVPRAAVEVNGELRQDKTKKVLLIFKKSKRSEIDQHRMSFTLLAVPDVPPAPDLSAVLPPVPPTPASSTSAPPVPLPPFEFTHPPFLLTITEEQRVCREVVALLKRAATGDYEVKLPSGKSADLKDESQRLEADCALLQPAPANDHNDYQAGTIFIRLNDEPATYLIVRATDDKDHAGLYIYRPDAKPFVTLYSTYKDQTSALLYEPIQLLLDALRAWHTGASTRQETHAGLDPQIGLKFLPRVLHAVWNGYLEALAQLQPATASPIGAPPAATQGSYFELPGVEAQLSYLVPPPLPKSVELSTDDEAQPENRVIESRARLRIDRRAERTACAVTLDGLEFIISGAAHDFFLGLVKEQAPEIAQAFDPHEPEPYAQALSADTARRDALVLLISSEPIPTPAFLVVCPGLMATVLQDFMFKCELKVEQKKDLIASAGTGQPATLPTDQSLLVRRLVNIKAVRPMQHAVQIIGGQIIQPDLTSEQYQYWHSFFKAVRRWRCRREPTA